jgi:hypothetical protein
VSQPTSIPLTPHQRRVITLALERMACDPSMDMRDAVEMEELAGYVIGNLTMEAEL